MKVFVTGGTGFLGLHLIQALIARNAEISCLVRKDVPLKKANICKQLVKWGVKLKFGDVVNYDTLCKILESRYDYVFHLAGVVAAKNKEDYEKINVNGTRNLLQAIQKVNVDVGRLIFMSSTSAMGAIRSDEPLNEEVIPRPAKPYEISKYKGEQLVERFHKESSIPATIVRAPMIYGFGEHSGILKLARVVAKGIIPVLSDKASLPLVYIKNLVNGLMLCAERSKKNLDIYIISDNRTYTLTEVAEAIASNLNIKPIRLKVPLALLKVVNLEYLRYTASNVRFSIDKALRELGYKPVDGLHKGMRETIQYYVLNGMLNCKNYPLSPLDALRMSFKEGEGFGTAYEYYIKTKILTKYLKRAYNVRKALVISLPRLHGSVVDLAVAMRELGIDVTTVKLQNEEDMEQILEKNFDIAIVVGDFIADLKKIILPLCARSIVVILFTTNIQNIFHVNRWGGTNSRQILCLNPAAYEFFDCPPFPSGIKIFSGKRLSDTRMLSILMFFLAFWGNIELKLPEKVKSKMSHMVMSYWKGG